jgi:L-threonylcarbamoyladenylate synthase
MTNANSFEEAIASLMAGGVGVMPTDTVYGLVARAVDKLAVERFYGLKQRTHKPGTVIAASVQQLVELGVQEQYLRRVDQWWPNPLSVEMPLGDELRYLHQDTGRQAFRVVADETVRALLVQTGPLVTTSVNRPGEPGAVNVEQARKCFEDNVDFYVDGGDLSDRAPSTIIGVAGDGKITVYRQGAVELD